CFYQLLTLLEVDADGKRIGLGRSMNGNARQQITANFQRGRAIGRALLHVREGESDFSDGVEVDLALGHKNAHSKMRLFSLTHRKSRAFRAGVTQARRRARLKGVVEPTVLNNSARLSRLQPDAGLGAHLGAAFSSKILQRADWRLQTQRVVRRRIENTNWPDTTPFHTTRWLQIGSLNIGNYGYITNETKLNH